MRSYIDIVTGGETKARLELESDKVDFWSEKRLFEVFIDTSDISAVKIGPKTVVQLYSDPYFFGLKKVISNGTTDKVKLYNIANNSSTFTGYVRSLRVWDYEYYRSIFGVRYCDDHGECRENEYCMCKSGHTKGEWCEESKKRCLPKSRYLNDKDKILHEDSLVDTKCLAYTFDNNIVTFRELKKKATRCSKNIIEGFSVFNERNMYSLYIWIVFLLILILRHA